MSKEPTRNGPTENVSDYIELHTLDGTPLRLRADFVISALGSSETKDRNTTVKLHECDSVSEYEVRESIDEIRGPFAKLSNLLLNPRYVAGIVPNTGSKKDEYPYTIKLHIPGGENFITASSPAEVEASIQAATLGSPR